MKKSEEPGVSMSITEVTHSEENQGLNLGSIGHDLSDSSDSSDEEFSAAESKHQDLSKSSVSGQAIMQSLRKSVFKIQVTSTIYSHDQPWSNPRIIDSSGSGFVVEIEGENYISTNAHVAEAAEVIKVRCAEGKKSYPTKVLWVDHECDLALLEIPPSLVDRVRPIEINTRPIMRGESVFVVGFPQMGEEVCITNGVVSRRELDDYMHSGRELLQYGVDAVINPGNSGGPVVDSAGKVVGWAFQGAGNGQGFIIPVDVYQHMKRDFIAQQHGGFPDLSLEWQTMTNTALRAKYGMQKSERGVLINKIHPLSDANGILLPNDIVMEINGHPVSNEGTVKMPGFGRLHFEYLVSRTNIPGAVNFKVRRQGALLTLTVPLQHGYDRTQLVKWQYENQADYFIYHGVVLKLLTQNDDLAIGDELQKKKAGDEIVLVNKVLNSDYTDGYEDVDDEILESINGQKFATLQEALALFADSQCDFYELKLKSGFNIVVPNVLHANQQKTQLAYQHHHEILAKYRILQVCSDTLRAQLTALNMERLRVMNDAHTAVNVVSSADGEVQSSSAPGFAASRLTPGQAHFARTIEGLSQRVMANTHQGLLSDVDDSDTVAMLSQDSDDRLLSSPTSTMSTSLFAVAAADTVMLSDDELSSLRSYSDDEVDVLSDAEKENQPPSHGYFLRSSVTSGHKRVRFSNEVEVVSDKKPRMN